MIKLTTSDILERVRYVMDELGIKNHLPTHQQILEVGRLNADHLKRVGNLKGLSLLMGLPLAPKPSKREYKGIYSMEDVRPSQAFNKQRETGTPYGELQKADVIEEFARVDLSQFEGMKSYAERVRHEI